MHLPPGEVHYHCVSHSGSFAPYTIASDAAAQWWHLTVRAPADGEVRYHRVSQSGSFAPPPYIAVDAAASEVATQLATCAPWTRVIGRVLRSMQWCVARLE